jgi:hypothetical protein
MDPELVVHVTPLLPPPETAALHAEVPFVRTVVGLQVTLTLVVTGLLTLSVTGTVIDGMLL